MRLCTCAVVSHAKPCLTLQTPSGLAANETKIRLKSLLSKNALQLALKAGESLLAAAVADESQSVSVTLQHHVTQWVNRLCSARVSYHTCLFGRDHGKRAAVVSLICGNLNVIGRESHDQYYSTADVL